MTKENRKLQQDGVTLARQAQKGGHIGGKHGFSLVDGVFLLIALLLVSAVAAIWMEREHERERTSAAKPSASVSASEASAAKARASDPDHRKRILQEAFAAAERWREELVPTVYANMTDNDWRTAARWIGYAQPFAGKRTCRGLANVEKVLASPSFAKRELSPDQHRQMLAEHAYHTAGIEGNILTLPETLRVVDGQPLVAGLEDHQHLTPRFRTSVKEIRNLQLAFVATQLMAVPSARPDQFRIDVETLHHVHRFVVKDLDVPTSPGGHRAPTRAFAHAG
jgi:hypothetical protein